MSNALVETRRAACSCVSVLFHLPSCELVHGLQARALPHVEQGNDVTCDAEDGAVWLHTPSTLTPMTASRARFLGDELHACAQILEKPR